MIIGIDDTDSNEGMCTTYLGALLLEELRAYGTVAEEPVLIRLNPTIPYKTRGNAAVALRVETEYPEKVMEHVLEGVETFARFECEKTNPGVVFVPEKDFERLEAPLWVFLGRAIRDVLSIEEAKALIFDLKIPFKGFKNGRGLIGALAACGAMLNLEKWDHTFEYLVYREKSRLSPFSPRKVEEESLYEADRATYPRTWDTVDYANGIPVCVPRSPDPVLFGIRGESVEAVSQAVARIRAEPAERCCVYRTNQGTDMHLLATESIGEIEDMRSYRLEGTVAGEEGPKTIEGGHVIFSVRDREGSELDCAAFEPTKNFRTLVRNLIPGDRVLLSGSVKNRTLNIEKLEIREMVPLYGEENPKCPDCGKHMKSAGKGQGFRCRNCGTSAGSKVRFEVERGLVPGIYEVPPCARRHLAKPLVRETAFLKDPGCKIYPSR
ncbi:MAG: tRNA(Ile)(2)-agmatinylcytidine synthase [Methanosarcinaceae archaeon]|nr:tRNA(Ile)(2)-agmatinylcytidine synthase [Methanosarcinaceae archaeon]